MVHQLDDPQQSGGWELQSHLQKGMHSANGFLKHLQCLQAWVQLCEPWSLVGHLCPSGCCKQ